MVGCPCVIQLTLKLNFFMPTHISISTGGGLNAHNRDVIA